MRQATRPGGLTWPVPALRRDGLLSSYGCSRWLMELNQMAQEEPARSSGQAWKKNQTWILLQKPRPISLLSRRETESEDEGTWQTDRGDPWHALCFQRPKQEAQQSLTERKREVGKECTVLTSEALGFFLHSCYERVTVFSSAQMQDEA